jgi:hypothetical protein
MKTKKCSKCKLEKNLSEFNKAKKELTGYASECKTCHNLLCATYRKNNPDKIDKYQHDNKDHLLKKRQETYHTLYCITKEQYKQIERDNCELCGKSHEEMEGDFA